MFKRRPAAHHQLASFSKGFPMRSRLSRAGLRRTTALAASALVGLVGLAGTAQAQTPTKLRFAADWVLQGPQAPFLLAQENGCYTRAGLDVTTDRGYGSGDTVIKVAAGTYDVGFADINAMVEYNARQPKPEERLIAFFMIYDGAALSIITRKDTGIGKPADLVGRTIAAPPGDASRRLFAVLAKANGVDPSAVKWMNVSADLRETMLARKNADAIAGAAFTGYIGVQAVGVPKDEVVVMRYPQFGARSTAAPWSSSRPSPMRMPARSPRSRSASPMRSPRASASPTWRSTPCSNARNSPTVRSRRSACSSRSTGR